MSGLRMRPLRRLVEEWRPSAVTSGAPAFPLAVLFGLNAVDELDRTAFAVLLPDIRTHFGLSNASALAIVAATTIAVLLVEIPLSFYADRRNRVRIATVGAAVWALFSAGTGLALTLGMLVAMRIGAGGGRAVVTPTHSSLLSDYYEPAARVKVFSAHRLASSVGQIAGPVLAGGIAMVVGWRAPFLLLALPTVVFVVLAMRLREPARGAHEGVVDERAPGVWETMRMLGRVRTLRRIWLAVPFLAIALFGVPTLLSLLYEDVFGLSAGQRGLVAAGIEPLQIIGILAAMPVVSRVAAGRPDALLRFVAVVGVVDGLLLVALAYAPHVLVAVGIHAVLAASIGTLVPAFMALVSMVAPPRVRSAAFTTMSVFAVPGIAVFLPLIGAVSDSVGIQASMLLLVPVSVAAGLLLASAAQFVQPDSGTPSTPPRAHRRRGLVVAGLAAVTAVVVGACGVGSAAVRDAPTTSTSLAAPGTSTTSSTTTRPTTTPSTTSTAAPRPAMPSVQRGDRGPNVAAVQRRLTALGYWNGRADAAFAELTEQALLAFQKVERLPRTGLYDSATRAALARATRPTAKSSSGDLIEIDKTRQVIFIVRGGAVRWTLNTSTGTEKRYRLAGSPDGWAMADTPVGRWTINREVDGLRRAALGTLYRPKYFHDDGIAIHGARDVPAQAASHGCARVTNAAMDWLWANKLAPIGSTVWVYGSI